MHTPGGGGGALLTLFSCVGWLSWRPLAWRVPASLAVPAGGVKGGGLCRAVCPRWGLHARKCPLGAAAGSKGSRRLAEDGAGGAAMGCKGGAPRISSGLPGAFSGWIVVCCPQAAGGRALTSHTTLASHHRVMCRKTTYSLGSGVFQMMGKVARDRQDAGLCFMGWSPQPRFFLGGDGKAASPSHPRPLPHAWPTQGPWSHSPTARCTGLPLPPHPCPSQPGGHGMTPAVAGTRPCWGGHQATTSLPPERG